MSHLPPHLTQSNANYYYEPQAYQSIDNLQDGSRQNINIIGSTSGQCQLESEVNSPTSYHSDNVVYQNQLPAQLQMFPTRQQLDDSLYLQTQQIAEQKSKQDYNLDQITSMTFTNSCSSTNMNYIRPVNPLQPGCNRYTSLSANQMYEQNLQYSEAPVIQRQNFQYGHEPTPIQFDEYREQPTVSLDESSSFSSKLQRQSQPMYYPSQIDVYPSMKQWQQQQQHSSQFLQQTNMLEQQSAIDQNEPQLGYENTHQCIEVHSGLAHPGNLIQSAKTNQIATLTNQIPRPNSNLETPFTYNNHQHQTLDELSTQGPFQRKQQTQQITTYKSEQGVTAPNSNNTMIDVNLRHSQTQQQQNQQECRERQQQQEFVELKASGAVSQDWLDTICRHVIEHLNRYGICVIDNFLGPVKGDLILKEVLQLYNGGQYTRGRLVNNKLTSETLSKGLEAIRNDRVIWIDGCEEGCSEINNLIQTLCSVIMNSSRLSLYSNNGLDKVVINKRTRAHVACYPGDGTRYIKHVDNPNDDGRVITSIYYLNKDWFSKRDGGLLRMFPADINEVANIEPLFDRVLFFWSDRRNPHEVLPAFRDRFAITVWYIGKNRSS